MHDLHTQHGKWSQAGVPKKGWTCTGFDDLEEPSQVCEMCESAEVRYVYFMEHPDYSDVLAVGCVCAENMEADYVRPREREKRLRTLARRRRTWGNQEWQWSARGNPYLNAEGFNLVLTHGTTGWRVTVTNRETDASQRGHKLFATEAEAKDAALKALLWAKEHVK